MTPNELRQLANELEQSDDQVNLEIEMVGGQKFTFTHEEMKVEDTTIKVREHPGL